MQAGVCRALCVACALLGVVSGGARAAEAYPQRAVRLIVPYPPGGAGDIVGRMLASKLTESFGQQVVVDNRGGGGQVIATQLAATAPPDGHTLFLSSATHSINPALRKNLPYNTLKDFDPTTLVAESPLVFVAHASLGVSNIKELIAAAKAKPGRINYASSGPGTGGHIAKRGKAALTICSTAFVSLGRAQARALGDAERPIAIIPHPFGVRSREAVRGIAEKCVDDLVQLLIGTTK